MVPVECKLSLKRKNLKLSWERDQDQFRVQSRDCQNFKSQNRQNFKSGIIKTLKQKPLELRSRILRTSKQDHQHFKAGDHQNFQRGDCQNFKGGNHQNSKTKDHVIIRTFSANFEVIRKHVSSELHNWTARGWSALPTSLKESFLKSITWVWGLHYLNTAAIFFIEEECLPWSNSWIAMLATTTRLYALLQLYTFAWV